MSLKSGRDRNSQVKKRREEGINGKKWAGKRDMRTLLRTL